MSSILEDVRHLQTGQERRPHQDSSAGNRSLEAEIRRRARGGAAGLRPQQAANLVNGCAEMEAAQTYEEFDGAQQAVGTLQEAYPDYFRAASAVARKEAAADLGRFRAWRREQRSLARAEDGAAAALAPAARACGGVLAFGALLALGINLIGYPALLASWGVAAGLYVLGCRLLKRRTSPLWKGVFSDPRGTCNAVWYAAAQAAAADLVRAREPGASAVEAGLKEVAETWSLRHRASIRYANEDYSAMSAAP